MALNATTTYAYLKVPQNAYIDSIKLDGYIYNYGHSYDWLTGSYSGAISGTV